MDRLIADLRRIRRRLLLVRALEAGLAGAVGAAPVALAVALVRIFLPEHVPLTAAHPALPLVLVPCGFVLALVARLAMGVPLREAALAADRGADLKERLATALEVLGSHAAGLLDERLLAQARAMAAPLDAARLPLARTLGLRAKVLLVAVLGLVVASFIPPVGGPPLAPQAAARAAERLERLAGDPSLAPAVRQAVERAVLRLREAGPRQGGADQATAAVYQAAAQADLVRRETLKVLDAAPNPEMRQMVRAAAKGDAPGAAGAARNLADRLAAAPDSGGMPPDERERLAASLTGAGVAAGKADLSKLAAELAAAARAIRLKDPAAAAALERLAAAMTGTLSEKAAGGVAAVVAAVGQARRTVGLPESPPAGLAQAAAAGAIGKGTVPFSQLPEKGTVPSSDKGTVPAAPVIPADVRPEDREVVRRYFGG